MIVYDPGRNLVIEEATSKLEGFQMMELNPSNKKLFEDCLAVERARLCDVVYSDRFMDIFEYCLRWGLLMEREMLLDSTVSVADIAERTALEAGVDSSDPRNFIRTASVIMTYCWKFGHELMKWFLTSIYDDVLDRSPRMAFPLYYLYEPTEVKEATLGWEWKK